MLKNSGRIVQPRFFKALFLLDDIIFVILRLEIIYIGNCRPEQQQKMRIVKRLYLFILKSFLPLFAMTFFIVLFIVLMQFLWKYIDDLVGKGLSVSLIAELFFYAAVSMVPMALPLAILLASLMTFGNFGEKFELTAMKASGISLLHAMRPLIVLISIVSVGAFFFQNNVLPPAQVKMWTLLFSMRQKSPEVEIPEGVFYDQIPGYNLFVKHKDRETGMLYNVMIYDVSHGGDNSTILMADSGRLAFTGDMRYLYLHLFNGEQFENLREQRSLDRNVPFRREEFADKEVLIPFDANFNRLDEGGMRNQYVGKNVSELRHTIDSVGLRLDSTGAVYAEDLRHTAFPLLRDRNSGRSSFNMNEAGSVNRSSGVINPDGYAGGCKTGSLSVGEADSVNTYQPINVDSLILAVDVSQRGRVFESALDISKRTVAEYQFKSMTVSDEKRIMRRHEIELIKKYTLSVACLIFFFIGAPLGAIIRKGGLGTPLVISVLLFLFYYIIDNTGYKMARDGRWPVWIGIWLSTFILAPLGVYVTYKAMNDSAVFDSDRYKAFFRKILGRKPERSVAYKEVIINDISEQEAIERLDALRERCLAFCERYGKRQSYKDYWRNGYDSREISAIAEELEGDVEYMSDCRNSLAVNKLVDYPVIRKLWFYHPGVRRWFGEVCKWLFPFGLPVYLIGIKAQSNLKEELRKVAGVSDSIVKILKESDGEAS
jgi:lipopolysaccharide export system permease protein